jgi:hypothetical protein
MYADVRDYFVSQMDTVASEGVRAMLRKTMIVLATAAALTGALSADAFARGGGGHGGAGGHMGGGFAGGHIGGGFGGAHMGGRFDHHRRFGGGWDYGFYDNGCSYGYPYHNPYSCYPSAN